MQHDELNERFGIPGSLRLEPGPGGLTRIVMTGPDGGTARLHLHGAHVTHWQPPGQRPVLWLSDSSWFEPGKPVRGGVPVCFPWFGQSDEFPDGPAHGFARTLEWSVESTGTRADGSPAVTLLLGAGEATRRHWPGDFELRYTVVAGRALRMTLVTRNVGPEPFTITQALHTYLGVSDVRNVLLRGLKDADYLDAMEGRKPKRQMDDPITFSSETDRVYLNTPADCALQDPQWGRTITIAKSGSDSTVVWNPWSAKAARMPDFGDDEWPGMLCIETANVADNAVNVPPGETHTLCAEISASD